MVTVAVRLAFVAALLAPSAAHGQGPAVYEVWARAADDVDPDALGLLVDEHFAPLPDRPSIAGRLPRGVLAARRTHTSYRMLDSAAELAANRRAWTPEEDVESVYRSYMATQEHELVGDPPAGSPAGAVWYIATILVGHMVEVREVGHLARTPGLARILPAGIAGAEDLEVETPGLDRRTLFTSVERMHESFEGFDDTLSRGDPRPILVRYRRLPSAPPPPELPQVFEATITAVHAPGDGPCELRVEEGAAIHPNRLLTLSLRAPELPHPAVIEQRLRETVRPRRLVSTEASRLDVLLTCAEHAASLPVRRDAVAQSLAGDGQLELSQGEIRVSLALRRAPR